MAVDLHATKQVLVVRYLFRQGVLALESREPFANGLAVSLFQDASELLLHCVAMSVDAKSVSNFMAYWEHIENASSNTARAQVPSKTAMASLNAARVAFKHFGQLPTPEDAARFRTNTEVFLKQTTLLFFAADFDAVSMSDLVSNVEVRSHIKNAEQYLGEGRFKDALESCGLAAYDLFKEGDRLLPSPGLDLVSTLRRIVPHNYDHEAIEIGRYLSEQLEAHRAALLRLMTRTSTVEYERFKALVPHINKTVGGKIYVHWNRSGPPDDEAAREEVRFCIDFAIDQALRLADIPGSAFG